MQRYISFEKTGFFSKTVIDYLDQSDTIKEFYTNFSELKSFNKQIEFKKEQPINREILVDVLKEQYNGVATSKKVTDNIKALSSDTTFTITTGHQLNLFTGPLYFIYKIISTINMCEQLYKEHPRHNFVPIYWMATEDHDFDEICFFNYKNELIKWDTSQNGAVGRFATDNIETVYSEFAKKLSNNNNSKHLLDLFSKAYLENDTLAGATRYLVNELFKDYGLVVLDADHSKLKKQFIPQFKNELFDNIGFKKVSETIQDLGLNYKIQVSPRAINLFYIKDQLRERIVFENNLYSVLNTDLSFSAQELLTELETHPERFSPNVIIRPLYQEAILPNLCYIGGGGELAYWFELKKMFKEQGVVFPLLSLRNSVQLVSSRQVLKLKKLNVSFDDIFLKQHELISKKVKEKTQVSFDFSGQKEFLKKQFNDLKLLIVKTDISFEGAVLAQEKKQLKGLSNLERKFLKAEKKRQKDFVTRLKTIQDELLPNYSLEERQRNFSEFYEEYGEVFIKRLKDSLNPFDYRFFIIEL